MLRLIFSAIAYVILAFPVAPVQPGPQVAADAEQAASASVRGDFACVPSRGGFPAAVSRHTEQAPGGMGEACDVEALPGGENGVPAVTGSPHGQPSATINAMASGKH